MVRLNKEKLSDKHIDELFDQLNHIVARMEKRQVGLFLHDLLGYEEKIMLSKRLATVVMLLEGYSMYKVAKTLKVSQSTVEKTRRALAEGAFVEVVTLLHKHKTNYTDILQVIDSILTVGGIMSHYGQARIPKSK